MKATAVLGGTALIAVCAMSPARAQFVDQQLWGTDGNVGAVLKAGNTLYVAGAFNRVVPNSGGGVEVDPVLGLPTRSIPKVAGVVEAVIPDGAGGWYIGGQFSAVGGHPRHNLAWVQSDGSISQWAPNPDAAVDALTFDGTTLFVGGQFMSIAGSPRSYLAGFAAWSGQLLEWDPGPDRPVRALNLLGGRLFVGGDFSSIAGATRWSLAEFDCANGRLTDWALRIGSPTGPGSVRTLAGSGDTLFMGGLIGVMEGVSRLHAGALNARTREVTAWNPRVTSPVGDISFGKGYVSAIAVSGQGVLVGGHFTGIGGSKRAGLAMVDRTTGQATPWNPAFGATFSDSSADISSIVVEGDSAYAAGTFLGVNGTDRAYCAKLDLNSSAVSPWDPQPTGPVHAIGSQRGRVFLGGRFAGLGTQGRQRAGLAAFDATTGAVKDWNPNPVGYGVVTIAMAEGRLFVGGYFWEIGGQPCDGLAAVDTLTGADTGWHPRVNDWPLTLEPVGDTLFVGGAFTAVDGQARGRIAAFDLMSGALINWAPSVNGDVFDIEVKDSTILVAGGFDRVNGTPRERGLAAVNRFSGALLDWDPQPSYWASAIEVVGDTLYVGGNFISIGGQPRSNLAALDLKSGQALDWRADANGRVMALATIGDTLFAGGLFYTIAGQSRNSIAAVDRHTGKLLDWDLGLSSSEYDIPNPVVWGLAAADHAVYVGGAFGRAGLAPVGGLVAYSFAPPPPEPPVQPKAVALAPIAPNPVHGPLGIRFDLPAQTATSITIFDVQGRRVARPLDRAVQSAGRHELMLEASRWPRGFYFCLLEAGPTRSVRKFVVLR